MSAFTQVEADVQHEFVVTTLTLLECPFGAHFLQGSFLFQRSYSSVMVNPTVAYCYGNSFIWEGL